MNVLTLIRIQLVIIAKLEIPGSERGSADTYRSRGRAIGNARV